MRRPSQANEAPLYVRWAPEGIPIALELRLELIDQLRREIEHGAKAGIEVGGLLVGTRPTAEAQVLRLDDVVLIPRSAEDGPVFMLDPREQDRFLTTRWDAQTKGSAAVGFFRSHLRSGALRPSLADRTLFSGQFRDDAYAVMLVDPRENFRTGIFVGTRARLPEQSSVPEFALEMDAFAGLPESEPAAARSASTGGGAFRRFLMGALAFALVLIVAFAVYQNLHGNPIVPSQEHEVGLAIAGTDVLSINWNHSAFDVRRATSAKLVITDGGVSRELPIGLDELRLGTVAYQHAAADVRVDMVLAMPGSTMVTQSASWRQ